MGRAPASGRQGSSLPGASRNAYVPYSYGSVKPGDGPEPMRTPRSSKRPPPDLQESLERAKPLFRAWGAQGGRERAKRLTSAERSDAARRAVQVRWNRLSKAQRAALARKAARA